MKDDFGDRPLVFGSVVGCRWWSLADTVHLIGQRGLPWHPGENVAGCEYGRWLDTLSAPVHHDAPYRHCGCGFWGYWTPEATIFDPSGKPRPVLGVVEGYGRTLIGPRGFRCQKARIIALCLAFQVTVDDPEAVRRSRWWPRPGMFWRGPKGMQTFDALTGSKPQQVPQKPAPEALYAIAAAVETAYEVPVYLNAGAMLDRHKLTPAPASGRVW